VKIVDLNILIYSVNADAPHHRTALNWWQEQLSGDETVGLPWVVINGFLRITTKQRLFPNPLSVEEAFGVADEWLAQPNVILINPGEKHWEILRGLLLKNGTAGNLTTDAHLAAMAVEYGSTLYSFDNDFLRFQPELRFVNLICP
jgi:uncharacterized protein